MERYPLTWPQGQPRTQNRRDAAFKVDFARARDEMLNELKLLRTREVVLSSNVPLRVDGLPMASASEPADPGVAVYFDRYTSGEWKPYVIACDAYRKVKWNLRAIGETVAALRSIQRHGASSMLEQAFTGFAALPPAHRGKPWHEVLGVEERACAADIRDAYRELARIHHPDAGGDAERMGEINRAFAEAKQLGAA